MSVKILAIVLLSVSASTVLGVLCGLFFRNIPHKFNDIILGFAAGVMLAASVLGLIEPAFSAGGWSLCLASVGIIAGAGFISFLDKIVPHLHRIAGIDSESHKGNGSISKTLLFVAAIALHKIPEGLATGVSFATENVRDVLTVATSMSLQNVPEAIVIVTPLLAVGISFPRVINISIAIAAVSAVSVLVGCGIASFFSGIAPFLLAAAGGAILYVVSDEMIPETHSHGCERAATFALIAGLVIVIVLQRFLTV